jgi:3,4-dihydroxy 2-butanone 4-phosphate synthase/GTP cyclohydrolase II
LTKTSDIHLPTSHKKPIFAENFKVKMSEIKLNTIPEAIEDLKNGKVIIVVDDENCENEGDFLSAAELTTQKLSIL